MTVEELIRKLSIMPQHATVIVFDGQMRKIDKIIPEVHKGKYVELELGRAIFEQVPHYYRNSRIDIEQVDRTEP